MIQYCVKRYLEQDGKIYYMNIFPCIQSVRMCIEKNEKIYEIDVRKTDEINENTYYGWLKSDGDENISFIYPIPGLVDINFPYGYKAEEASGKGKLVIVEIEEIREVKY